MMIMIMIMIIIIIIIIIIITTPKERIKVESGYYRHVSTCIKKIHEEPRKVPFLIILSDGCYTQFPVRILPPTSCMLAGVRLAVIGSDLHRGDETILNFATVC